MGPPFPGERVSKYLIYHVDEGLSIILTETLNLFSFIAVREDGHDQGDAFIRGTGTVNQAFPCCNAATREKPVRLTDSWFQS